MSAEVPGISTAYCIKSADMGSRLEIGRCFNAISILRPHVLEADFVDIVQLQAAEGYKIAYVEIAGEIVAAAGYRVCHFLAWGTVMYIDDLITNPGARRLGLGAALLEWLSSQSIASGCNQMHLDTGMMRHDAHRLYLNNGFTVDCLHLSKALRDVPFLAETYHGL